MALSALIFDLDGTLVDANMLHARAFEEAFEQAGYRVGADRIVQEIGKGGDRIVPHLLGEEAEADHGDAIRNGHDEHYHELIEAEGVSLCPGALEVLESLQERGLKTAISTGAKREAVEQVMQHGEVDLTEHVDLLVTDTDVEESKPHPDTVQATVRKLDVSPAACAMVGDTPWDALAARRAGVTLVAVGTGAHSEKQLREAGARAVYDDAAALNEHLDEALAVASPGEATLTTGRIDALMDEALAEAEAGLDEGELPVGAVVARPDGTVLARGRNRARQHSSTLVHAELVAMQELSKESPDLPNDLVLVSTLEPCAMCLGAALETGIDTLAYGLPAPPNGGFARCRPTARESFPRVLGSVRSDDSRDLLERFVERRLDHTFAQQVLAEAGAASVASV